MYKLVKSTIRHQTPNLVRVGFAAAVVAVGIALSSCSTQVVLGDNNAYMQQDGNVRHGSHHYNDADRQSLDILFSEAASSGVTHKSCTKLATAKKGCGTTKKARQS